MRARLTAALAVSTLMSGAVLFAQGFNVRPGTWEFTAQMEGDALLDGVPPNMRAAIEAQLKTPHTSQSCVSADDVKKLNLGKLEDDDSECKIVTSKITPAVGDVVRQCSGDDPRTETAHFEASSPTSLKASITSKSAKGVMTITMTGRWLNAECKD